MLAPALKRQNIAGGAHQALHHDRTRRARQRARVVAVHISVGCPGMAVQVDPIKPRVESAYGFSTRMR
jgi:hypothetical protein